MCYEKSRVAATRKIAVTKPNSIAGPSANTPHQKGDEVNDPGGRHNPKAIAYIRMYNRMPASNGKNSLPNARAGLIVLRNAPK